MSSGGPLLGKTAIVLGGTRGIGGGVSRALAVAGAQVAMIFQSRATEARAFATEVGGGSFALQCDVANMDEQEQTLDVAFARLGRLDILVCSAGLTITGRLANYADDAFDRSFAVNVRSPFYAARKAATCMADGGRIVLIGSSVAVRLPGVGATLYAASKASLDGLVRGLARDLGDRGITANVIHPGPIATERNAGAADRGGVAAGPLAIRRYGQVEEVAAQVLALCAPFGAWTTGQSICVDGGWTA